MPNNTGYFLLSDYGDVWAYGSAQLPANFTKPTGVVNTTCSINVPVPGSTSTYEQVQDLFMGIAPTPDGKGFWLVTSCGEVYTFGDAQYYGNTPQMMNRWVTGIATGPTVNGQTGYWIAGADGAVYTPPDLSGYPFFGSMGGKTLNAPVTGIASYLSPGSSLNGYWLTGADGGLFSFGAAGYHGNTLFSAPPPPPPPPPPPNQATGAGNPASDSVNPCAGDPVDCVSRDFWETYHDVKAPGAAPGFDLTRTYNSIATPVPVTQTGAEVQGIFGPNWWSNYDLRLSFNPAAVTVIEEDGSTVTFLPSSTGYQAPSWLYATLTENPDGTFTFERRGHDTYTFSSDGTLLAATNQAGDTTTYHDNSAGQPTSITDSAGQTITLAYGSNGYVSSATWDGLTTTYGYTGGVLTSVTSPTGQTTTYVYSGNEITSITGPKGVLTNTYSASVTGQVTSQTNNGVTTAFSYTGNGLTGSGTTTINYPSGKVVTEQVDKGQMTSKSVATGAGAAATTTYLYDETALAQSCSVDPVDEAAGVTCPTTVGAPHVTGTTTKAYDSKGNVTSSTDALGNTTQSAYNVYNEPWCTVDAADYANGTRCPTTAPSTPPAPGAADPNLGETINFYNSTGLLTATTDPLGRTTTYAYTPMGGSVPPDLRYCTVDAANDAKGVNCPAYGAAHVTGTTTETFDALGNVVSTTTPDGATTTSAYADAAHPTLPSSTTAPDGTTTSFTYDAAGQVTKQVVSFHGYSATTLHAYTLTGNLYCTVQPAEAAKGVTCPSAPPGAPSPTSDPYLGATIDTYNADLELVQQTSPTGGVTEHAYDAAGQVYCTVDPNVALFGTTCPTSPPATAPSPTSDPYPGVTIDTYNTRDELAQQTNPDGGITTYTYDADGRKISQSVESKNATADPTVTTTYVRNLDGQVTSTTVDAGGSGAATTLTSYDPNGNAYCTVSPDAVAAGSSTYQCPAWQPSWIVTPPTPSGEYASSPTATQAEHASLTFANAAGETVESSNADGSFTLEAYTPDGERYCTVDPTTVALGVTCPTTPPTSPPAKGSDPGTTITIYDPAGLVTSVTNQLGDTTITGYDAFGNKVSTTNADGDTTTYCYYADSCASGAPSSGGSGSLLYATTTPATTSDPNGMTTTVTYYPGGAPDVTTTPAGTETDTYDATGALSSKTYAAASGYATTPTVTDTYEPGGQLATTSDGRGDDRHLRTGWPRGHDLVRAGIGHGALGHDAHLRLLRHRRARAHRLPLHGDGHRPDGHLHLQRPRRGGEPE